MKRKLICGLICVLMLSGCHKTDTKQDARKKDVDSTITTESTYNYEEMLQPTPVPEELSKSVSYDKDGNVESALIYEDGNIIQEFHYSKGDSDEEYQTNYYYEDGLLMKEEVVYNGKVSEGYKEYTHDEQGRITSKFEYDGEGNLIDSWEYKYEELGYTVETWIIPMSGKKVYRSNPYGDRISYEEYNESGELTDQELYEYEYDDNKNVLDKKTYSNGVVTDEEIFEYDRFNNVIKHSTYYCGKLIREMIVEYSPDYSQATFDFIGYYGNEEGESTSYFLKKFDSNGNIIENHWYAGGKESDDIQITYYTYDKNGNILSEEFGDQKNIYEYDSEGNLISSSTYIKGEVVSASTYEYNYE